MLDLFNKTKSYVGEEFNTIYEDQKGTLLEILGHIIKTNAKILDIYFKPSVKQLILDTDRIWGIKDIDSAGYVITDMDIDKLYKLYMIVRPEIKTCIKTYIKETIKLDTSHKLFTWYASIVLGSNNE